MFSDYLFPCSVLAVKFLFRLAAGQHVSRVVLVRAILSFPVDLAFLALSFLAVLLTYLQARAPFPLSTKDILGVFLVSIVAAFLVQLFARKSDDQYTLEKYFASVCWMIPAYLISIYSLSVLIAASLK
jgi:hypothetical protein